MIKIVCSILLATLPFISQAQEFCDSVFIDPDTIYITEEDSTFNLSVHYTGSRDASYSYLSFELTDTTYLVIDNYAVTNGISGPYVYSDEYAIRFKAQSIPPNTEVNATLWFFHGEPIDCHIPLTFIINRFSASAPIAPVLQNSIVYPNPFTDNLVIRSDHQELEIKISDMNGTVVSSGSILSGNPLNLEDLPSGVYFFKIRTENGITVKRVVKL